MDNDEKYTQVIAQTKSLLASVEKGLKENQEKLEQAIRESNIEPEKFWKAVEKLSSEALVLEAKSDLTKEIATEKEFSKEQKSKKISRNSLV